MHTNRVKKILKSGGLAMDANFAPSPEVRIMKSMREQIGAARTEMNLY